MKLIWKIIGVLLGAALLGALIAPWVHAFLISVCHAPFPFHRVLNRCILSWLIFFLILFRRDLFARPLGRMGLSRSPGWGRELGGGMLFAVLSFAALMTIYVGLGARELKAGFLSLHWVSRVLEYAVAALFIGVFEEIFFRGFILQGLMETRRKWVAVAVSSLFYAFTHFLKPESMAVPQTVTLLYSFQSLLRFLEPLRHWTQIIPSFVGLFLLGMVLAYAYLKTGRLFYSIGLHAGWVFCIKISSSFLNSTLLGGEHWYFGGSRVVNGFMGWAFMVVSFLWVRYFVWGKKKETSTQYV